MEQFYLEDKEFNYIMYNSLPGLADYILDHPKEYYDGWGVTVTHKKPTGIIVKDVKPYEKIFLSPCNKNLFQPRFCSKQS